MVTPEKKMEIYGEMHRDWRFWVCYLISVFLMTQLLQFFFQFEDMVPTILMVIVVSWMFNRIFYSHYENVILAEERRDK